MGELYRFIRRSVIIQVSTVVVAGSLATAAPISMQTNPESEAVELDISDLCSYDLSDYDTLKPLVEKVFLEEPTAARAHQVFKTFGNFEYLGTQELPLIRDGRFVPGEGQYLLSGEKIFGGKVVCEKPFNNKDVWWFYVHEGTSGEMLNLDFYVLIDDENFAKRDIPLRPQYFADSHIFRAALHNIIDERAPPIQVLVDQLVGNGFSVKRYDGGRSGKVRYYFDGENVRHWNLVFPAIGGANGFFRASVFVDENGNYTK